MDDARFARERARSLAERGYGDDYVRADLERRGVSVESVESAIATLAPEPARARAEVARLGGGARAARTLARKGFGEDAVEDAVGTALRATPAGGYDTATSPDISPA